VNEFSPVLYTFILEIVIYIKQYILYIGIYTSQIKE